MTAYELKQKAINAQYEQATKDIENATEKCNYCTSCTVCVGTPLFKEAAEKLAEDGYNVKIFISNINVLSYNEVSWAEASESKKGTVEIIDMRNALSKESLTAEKKGGFNSESENIDPFSEAFSEIFQKFIESLK